jgi:hypothetical protein
MGRRKVLNRGSATVSEIEFNLELIHLICVVYICYDLTTRITFIPKYYSEFQIKQNKMGVGACGMNGEGERRGTYGVSMTKPKERDNLENLCVDRRIILK